VKKIQIVTVFNDQNVINFIKKKLNLLLVNVEKKGLFNDIILMKFCFFIILETV